VHREVLEFLAYKSDHNSGMEVATGFKQKSNCSFEEDLYCDTKI